MGDVQVTTLHQLKSHRATGTWRSERSAQVIRFPTDVDTLIDQAEATQSSLEQLRADGPEMALSMALAEVVADKAADAGAPQGLPNATAIEEAIALLLMLPMDVAVPEPVIEGSGTVAWVWDSEPGKFLALAVNGTGSLQHSTLNTWGTAPLGGRLPAEVLELLATFSA